MIEATDLLIEKHKANPTFRELLENGSTTSGKSYRVRNGSQKSELGSGSAFGFRAPSSAIGRSGFTSTETSFLGDGFSCNDVLQTIARKTNEYYQARNDYYDKLREAIGAGWGIGNPMPNDPDMPDLGLIDYWAFVELEVAIATMEKLHLELGILATLSNLNNCIYG